jgi:hypothetical protein
MLKQAESTRHVTISERPGLWERRTGIVATHWFIRHGDLADTLRMAEMLLGDKKDLIHKAVGWMLREVGKRDVTAVEEFLGQHCHRAVPGGESYLRTEVLDRKTGVADCGRRACRTA